MPKVFELDPDSIRADFQLNWALYNGSDTITDSEWVVPFGLTKADESNTTTTTTVFLTGGTVGEEYDIKNIVTLDIVEETKRAWTIRIKIVDVS